MNRWTRVLVGVIVACVVLATLTVLIARLVFTEKRILAAITPRLESAINRPIHIGRAGISFGGGIGVWVGDVAIGNADGFSDNPMLVLHRFDFKARFWPLLVGRVEIDHVEVIAPSLLIEYDTTGRSNLDDLMSSPADTLAQPAPSGVRAGPVLGVERILISEGSLLRRDFQNGNFLTVDGIAMEATFPDLDQIGDRIRFVTSVAFDSLGFRREHDTTTSEWILASGEPRAYAEGVWNRSQSSIQIDSLLLRWWGTEIGARGAAETFPSVTEFRLNARMAPTSLEQFVQQFKQVYPQASDWRIEGRAEGTMEGIFVWPYPEGSVPEWNMTLSIQGLTWKMTEPDIDIALPQFELRGDGQTLSWTSSNGHVGDGTFSINGSIDRLFSDDRTISARVRATTPIAIVDAIAPQAVDGTLDGTVSADLTVFGRVDQWRRWRIAGDVTADPVVIRDASWTFDSLRVDAKLSSDGSRATLQYCSWTAGRSTGHATGSIDNVQSLITLAMDAPDVPRGNLDIVSIYLDLDQFIGETEPDSVAPDAESAEENPVPTIIVSGRLTADTALYSGLVFSNMESEYKYANNVLVLDPIHGHVLQGRLRGTLTWNIENWARPSFSTTIRADSIEANQFLSRYLGWAGGVFGAVSLEGTFAGAGQDAPHILPTLTAVGRAQLQEGRIESAPLLASIADQIKVPALAKPHLLRDARVPFRVEDGRVITDPLTFATPDAKFRCIGSFGFDRTLNYDIAVTPLKESGILGKTDYEFGLTGSVTKPAVRLDATKIGKQAIDKLLEQTVDSAKSKTVNRLLDKLTNPKKP